MDPKLWYIKGLPLFAASADLAQRLKLIGRVERWGHRANVALRADPGEVQVVIAGGVELSDGRYDSLALLSPGDVFGDFGTSDRACTLRAHDDLLIASFDRETFEHETSAHLGVLRANVGVVRRRELTVPVSSLLYTAPTLRLANVLLHVAQAIGTVDGDCATLDFQPRPRGLARVSGLADPTVSDIVEAFKRDRIVEVGRTQLVIPSIERMRQLAIG